MRVGLDDTRLKFINSSFAGAQVAFPIPPRTGNTSFTSSPVFVVEDILNRNVAYKVNRIRGVLLPDPTLLLILVNDMGTPGGDCSSHCFGEGRRTVHIRTNNMVEEYFCTPC